MHLSSQTPGVCFVALLPARGEKVAEGRMRGFVSCITPHPHSASLRVSLSPRLRGEGPTHHCGLVGLGARKAFDSLLEAACGVGGKRRISELR